MRRTPHILVGSAAFALCALIGGETSEPLAQAPTIDDPLREALGGIDFVADKKHFDALLGGEAAAELIAIARDEDSKLDPGLRVRAYRALALYPEQTSVALLDAVEEHASSLIETGVEIIYAKAAMSSLSAVSRTRPTAIQSLAIGQLGDVLEHPVIDLRAAAARSLGKTGLASARSLLEGRRAVETDALVIDSIERALAELGAAP